MKLRGIIVEDFCNYKLPSMFLACTSCDWKCCLECGADVSLCQNMPLTSSPILDIPDKDIYSLFSVNKISKAVVVGGLEPLLQFTELEQLIGLFRHNGEYCDFVIYTGYYPNEIVNEIASLSLYKNIIIKFGRYIPNRANIYDNVLGVTLSSDNQFAVRIT